MSGFVPQTHFRRRAADVGRRVEPRLSVLALSAATVVLLDTLLISETGSFALRAVDACATLVCGAIALRIGWRIRYGKPTRTELPAPAATAERAAPVHKRSSRSPDSQRLHQRSAASRRPPRRA
jgi:hypothetical protein